jgi:nucleotide-binding universal stress UspA family protein
MPTPTYRNFHMSPVGKDRFEMLERERDATGVTAELTGMFAASVGSGLQQLGLDCDADLLVVGSSSTSPVRRVLVGDDARGTVAGASCPVAVAPHDYAEQADEIETVGVAYNDGAEAEAALAVAREVAATHGARLLALTVVTPIAGAMRDVPALERAARDSLRQFEGVEGRVAVGTAAGELAAFGDELDLLVVGSRGHGPLRRLILGSTSVQLTREARCALLIIPRPGGSEVPDAS